MAGWWDVGLLDLGMVACSDEVVWMVETLETFGDV